MVSNLIQQVAMTEHEEQAAGKSIAEVFDALSREIGSLFEHIEDADQLVDELRGGEEE